MRFRVARIRAPLAVASHAGEETRARLPRAGQVAVARGVMADPSMGGDPADFSPANAVPGAAPAGGQSWPPWARRLNAAGVGSAMPVPPPLPQPGLRPAFGRTKFRDLLNRDAGAAPSVGRLRLRAQAGNPEAPFRSRAGRDRPLPGERRHPICRPAARPSRTTLAGNRAVPRPDAPRRAPADDGRGPRKDPADRSCNYVAMQHTHRLFAIIICFCESSPPSRGASRRVPPAPR